MKFLVPVDGSAASERAVDYAVAWALKIPGATVLLVNVQTREALGLSDIDAYPGDERELGARASEKVLRRAALRCERLGLRVQTRDGYGPIADTIAGIAREARADLIVMGTHGRGRIGSALLGSVAAGVVHLAEIPVTLVKQGEAQRPPA